MKAFLFGLILALALVFGGQLYFKKQLEGRPAWNYPREESHIWEPDAVLAMVNKKNAKVPYHFVQAGEVLPKTRDTYYTTDQWGTRLTARSAATHSQYFLALMGCSMIFGQGINDDETLSYYLQKELPQAHSYNFGVSGYGPHQLLAWLESGSIKKQVQEKKGIGIYSFITDHIYRVTRSHGIIAEFAPGQPYYRADENKIPRRDLGPPDQEDRPWHLLVRWISKHPILQFFGLRFPKLFEADFQFFCSVVARMRDVFQENFPGSPFFVLFHPLGTNKGDPMDQRVRTCFEQRGLTLIDIDFDDRKDRAELMNVDHLHPSAQGNALLAKSLVSILKQQGLVP